MFRYLRQPHQFAERPACQRASDVKGLGRAPIRADGAALLVDGKAEADGIRLQIARFSEICQKGLT